jgi:hypothetical protein
LVSETCLFKEASSWFDSNNSACVLANSSVFDLSASFNASRELFYVKKECPWHNDMDL